MDYETNRISNEFFQGFDPLDLISEFGSPLYVYNENVLRKSCRDLTGLVKQMDFRVNYSTKANSNPNLLKIVKEEGCLVDAMSPGELHLDLLSGYQSHEILYVCNNVSQSEMQNALKHQVLLSVDSLSQLETLGQVNQGGKVMIRLNPGIGAGHHQKVITAGKNTKFGIDPNDHTKVQAILNKYQMRLVGINQHIGSLFMEADAYCQAAQVLLELAADYPNLEIIDFGGGFGIPYHKIENETRLDLNELSTKLEKLLSDFVHKTKYQGKFYIEPGRYIVAESAILLGTVTASKTNGETNYIGSDLGFNVLARPMVYNSHHDVEIYSKNKLSNSFNQTVVGNICESGDILASNRKLPMAQVNDIIAVLDSGAYGFSMSSNYNERLRPAELLITASNSLKLIRKRDSLEDLVRNIL